MEAAVKKRRCGSGLWRFFIFLMAIERTACCMSKCTSHALIEMRLLARRRKMKARMTAMPFLLSRRESCGQVPSKYVVMDVKSDDRSGFRSGETVSAES